MPDATLDASYPAYRCTASGKPYSHQQRKLPFILRQFAQILENLACGFRRLIPFFLFLRVTDQSTQLLTIGIGPQIQYFSDGVITLIDQTIAQVFQFMEQHHLLVVTVFQLIQRLIHLGVDVIGNGVHIDHVIHFSLSSGISSSCEHAKIAADKFEGKVDVIDTKSLSTGIALQAEYACRLREKGASPEEIVKALTARVPFDQTSFSLESVNYLYKGGRCSALAAMAANVLGLKPEIYVKDGKMGPGKKYRGPMKKVVLNYVEDTLAEYNNPDREICFVTYSTAPEDVVEAVVERVKQAGFRRVYATTAGATISCHCGPHCLGILYFNDGEHPLE